MKNIEIHPNNKELEKHNVEVRGFKVNLICKNCQRTWGIWFADENDYLTRGLPDGWYTCNSCRGEA